jgi:hypothetical protein
MCTLQNKLQKIEETRTKKKKGNAVRARWRDGERNTLGKLLRSDALGVLTIGAR